MEIRSNSKVGEIAAASMAAIRVFEDFGIDYCCGGEQSIGEACQPGGVDPEGLIQAIRDTMLSAAPGTRDWWAEPLAPDPPHSVGAPRVSEARIAKDPKGVGCSLCNLPGAGRRHAGSSAGDILPSKRRP